MKLRRSRKEVQLYLFRPVAPEPQPDQALPSNDESPQRAKDAEHRRFYRAMRRSQLLLDFPQHE